MSWDKNTVNCSELNAVKKTLDQLGVPYKESVIAIFRGRGLNDDFKEGEEAIYKLRRLEYNNWVILEYVELDADCDVDDVILSEGFLLAEEPCYWEAIRRTDIFGNYEEEDVVSNPVGYVDL